MPDEIEITKTKATELRTEVDSIINVYKNLENNHIP